MLTVPRIPNVLSFRVDKLVVVALVSSELALAWVHKAWRFQRGIMFSLTRALDAAFHGRYDSVHRGFMPTRQEHEHERCFERNDFVRRRNKDVTDTGKPRCAREEEDSGQVLRAMATWSLTISPRRES